MRIVDKIGWDFRSRVCFLRNLSLLPRPSLPSGIARRVAAPLILSYNDKMLDVFYRVLNLSLLNLRATLKDVIIS